MPPLLAILAVLLALVPRTPAQDTLAVTPLARAAASEQYDGLGKALSGMIVSDLSTVPGLRLVERDRLDAVLAEIDLAQSGFLDEKTAQKLGKGVGAQLVLTGSFSVVGEVFLMDARIVRVQSGEIVKAADASGKANEFVAVEKSLVESLLSGLAIQLDAGHRRKLMLQAPTEQFTAFAAYGEGLARKEEGQLDAARQAFAKAVEEDPQFAEARAALDGLVSLVADEKQARLDAAKQITDQRYARLLADAPDERTRPANFVDDSYSLGLFALRLAVLEGEGLDCQRYDEMLHYLDRAGWQIVVPPRKEKEGVFSYELSRLATAYGLDTYVPRPDLPPRLRDSPITRASSLWQRTDRSFFAPQNWRDPQHTLYDSLRACYTPADRLKQLDRVIVKLSASPAGSVRTGNGDSALTILEWYQLAWARTRAEYLGANDELRKRTAALLAARPNDKGDMLRAVEDVLFLAKLHADHEARRFRQTPETLYAYMTALRDGDGKILNLDAPLCGMVYLEGKSSAADWVARYDAAVVPGDTWLPNHIDGAGTRWAISRDLGCQKRLPARFKDYDQIVEFVRAAGPRVSAEKKADPSCARDVAQLALMENGPALVAQNPAAASAMANQAMWFYYGLVTDGCLAE